MRTARRPAHSRRETSSSPVWGVQSIRHRWDIICAASFQTQHSFLPAQLVTCPRMRPRLPRKASSSSDREWYCLTRIPSISVAVPAVIIRMLVNFRTWAHPPQTLYEKGRGYLQRLRRAAATTALRYSVVMPPPCSVDRGWVDHHFAIRQALLAPPFGQNLPVRGLAAAADLATAATDPSGTMGAPAQSPYSSRCCAHASCCAGTRPPRC